MDILLSFLIIIVGATVTARYLPQALTWFFNKFPNQFKPLDTEPPTLSFPTTSQGKISIKTHRVSAQINQEDHTADQPTPAHKPLPLH